jgi:hypothetical protein
MEGYYKHSFNYVYFINRWSRSYRHDRASFTIIGITRWFSGPLDYRWTLCFFGLECHIWMKRQWIETQPKDLDQQRDNYYNRDRPFERKK